MIARNDNFEPAEQTPLPLPAYRFGTLESPLTTLARSAGFASFEDLACHVRDGATIIATAPEICGRSIGNALLIRDGCEQFGVCVIEVLSAGHAEQLVLASDTAHRVGTA